MNSNIRSKLICALIGIVFLWTSGTNSIALADSYRLVTLEYPPYEYTENGVVKGVAVDIVKETFKLMGHDAKIEIWPWSRSLEMLKNGDADGIFTFFKTSEREKYTYFSQEIMPPQKITLWTRKGSDIVFNGDLASLKKYRIGVVRKTSYGEKFDTAVKNGSVKVIESYTIEECIKQLANNRIDIWVSNHRGAVYELKKQGKSGELREIPQHIQETPTYVGFSRKLKLENLKNEFDSALIKLKKSGKYDKIIREYSIY
jgi:polar amino acid transport system substrate-binding protein